jgi:hypothetical protein
MFCLEVKKERCKVALLKPVFRIRRIRINFEPPGAAPGSVIVCTDPDPSINKQKNEETLISTVL